MVVEKKGKKIISIKAILKQLLKKFLSQKRSQEIKWPKKLISTSYFIDI